MKSGTSFFKSLGAILLTGVLVMCTPTVGHATELEEKADSLSSQLKDLEKELSQTTASINNVVDEIEEQKMNLLNAEDNKDKQYDDMKLRIKYMYENGTSSMLQILLESNSIASLEANIEYIKVITEYDNEMLQKYREAYRDVEAKSGELQGKRTELAELQTSLEKKISGVQTALTDTKSEIEKEQKAALEAEIAKAKALAEAASPSAPNTDNVVAENNPSESNPEPSPAPEQPPTAPSPGGSGTEMLYTLDEFLFSGRIYWNEYEFTYYSQSVLPGGGLSIPGRHVNADGYVSDGDGYICLAGSADKGTVYDTPFGYQGKIYDRGTSGNHLDVYIR